MRGKKLLTVLAISAVLFSGCGLKSGETVIKVNDTDITRAQFDKTFNKQANSGMAAALGIDVKDKKNAFMYLLVKERVVNELTVKALLEQELQKRGITVSKEDTNNAIKEIIEKVGSKEQLDAILKQNNISSSDFRKELTEEIKMKKLASELGSSNVTDADCKKYYKQNPDKFQYPEKIRASHILIAASPQEIEEIIISDKNNKNLAPDQVKSKVNEELAAKKAKAQELLAQAKKDPSQFAKLAKENSDDTTSAQKGGDLGFFSAKEMVPEFSKAAFSVKPNTVNNSVVQTVYGYHIIFVTDRMTAGKQPYEKVKNNIKAYLENQKQVELLDNLTESLKKNAKIEYADSSFNPVTIREELGKQLQQQNEDSN
ncbi:MAG: peptidylprolyl isomerase [Heliobacteriaceae bacterium]|jgi:parvulin-like peptidyl-prolyl isomerase|nr:peptidylprolyl isomerase [Heliobacteriaceae bacterium]